MFCQKVIANTRIGIKNVYHSIFLCPGTASVARFIAHAVKYAIGQCGQQHIKRVRFRLNIFGAQQLYVKPLTTYVHMTWATF